MVEAESIIFAVNTSGTLAIGAICLFVVSTTLRDLEDKKIQSFTRRLLLAISLLILYVSYYAFYRTFLLGSSLARLPLYFLLVFVFLALIYGVVAFEGIADAYGVSNQKKLEKAQRQEGA